MNQLTNCFGFSLGKTDQELSFEQRNIIYAKEVREYGFLREDRLADASKVPKHESIQLSYNNGTVQIDSLPSGCKELCFVIGGNRFDALTINFEDIDTIFPDHQVIRLERPEKNKAYDLCSIAGVKEIQRLKGMGSVYLTNDITGYGHFRVIEGSFVTAVLLKSGYIRVDLKNLVCESLCFRMSKLYDNAFDVIVDTDIRAGDVYLSHVYDGIVIYNPALASALRHQAILMRIDTDKGLFCGVCEFCDPVETSIDHFIDANRYNGWSSHVQNRKMFSDFD